MLEIDGVRPREVLVGEGLSVTAQGSRLARVELIDHTCADAPIWISDPSDGGGLRMLPRSADPDDVDVASDFVAVASLPTAPTPYVLFQSAGHARFIVHTTDGQQAELRVVACESAIMARLGSRPGYPDRAGQLPARLVLRNLVTSSEPWFSGRAAELVGKALSQYGAGG